MTVLPVTEEEEALSGFLMGEVDRILGCVEWLLDSEDGLITDEAAEFDC